MTNPSWGDFATFDESAYPELWDGVVGAWCPSLGPTGLRLHDHSRRNNWGTLTNMDPATDWVVSGGQYALDFDGVNDYVGHGNVLNDVVVGTSAQFTISQWINVRANVNHFSCSKLDSSLTQRQFFLRANDDGLDFTWYGALDATSFRVIRAAYTFTAAGWAHIAATFHAGIADADQKVSLFINGAKKSLTIPFTAGSPVSIQSGTSQFLLGGAFTSGVITAPFSGLISETVVHRRVLGDNEIRELYQLGRGGMFQRRRRTLRRVGVEQGAAGARRRRILTGMV